MVVYEGYESDDQDLQNQLDKKITVIISTSL
jgi:hypothetical protein